MFCTECGTKLEDNATFCVNCGKQMAVPVAEPVATVVEENVPVAEPVAPVAESAVPVAEPAAPAVEPEVPVAEPVAPVVEPVAPAVEPVTPVSNQSMYSQPTTNTSMYSEPASQSMYSQPATNTSMYSEPASQMSGAAYGAAQGATYGATQNTYGNTQNTYGNMQNTYGAQNNASYNYNGAIPQQPQKKKKGKGCLIAVIIAAVIGLLGILAIVIAIFAAISFFGSEDESEVGYSYEYSYDYSEDDSLISSGDSEISEPSEAESEFVVPSELDSMMESESNNNSEVAGTTTTYTVEDITGEWYGESTLVEVTGADELQEYLEGLYGRSLSSWEVEGLSTATPNSTDMFDLIVYDYAGDDGKIYPGSWEMDLYMGDFFGSQLWDDWDLLTYDEFSYGDRSLGCIELDENNCFYLEVMEVDYLGEYGSVYFDAYDYDVQDYEVEEDGAYGVVFSGQVTEGNYGPQITGEIIIMFQYGDMEEPYGMAYDYTLSSFYPE